MFSFSPLSSSSTSPIPTLSPSPHFQSDKEGSENTTNPLPCWATQALRDLTRVESELRCVRERQAAATEIVKRGVERAILGTRREERRLLERVEQDHRDAQQHLEQVQKANMAATRLSNALLAQRLRKVAHLRDQIQQDSGGHDQNLLQKGVAELLKPWEISLSLKKVRFKPSSQPNAVPFGDIQVQEHNLSHPVGGCGPKGQFCVLHSENLYCGDTNQQGTREETSMPDSSGPEVPGLSLVSPSSRVVRKICLSTKSDEESREELKLNPPKMQCQPTKNEQSEQKYQDNETELQTFKPHREDHCLTIPPLLHNGDMECKDPNYMMKNNDRHYFPRIQRKLSSAMTSGMEPFPSQQKGRKEQISQHWSLDSHNVDNGRARPDFNRHALSSPTSREPLATQSCLDLPSRGQTQSSLSYSSDEPLLETPGDSGRALSPADSLDSCYTFIVSSPHDYNKSRGYMNKKSHLSKSVADLTHKACPLVMDERREHVGVCRLNHHSLSTTSRLSRGQIFPKQSGQTIVQQPQKRSTVGQTIGVTRSLSMSVIYGTSKEPNRGRDREDTALLEMKEEGNLFFSELHIGESNLIHQFGKQGSGRSELTLPSGLHATPRGQVFIVDCGNARVQVTDSRGNIFQQVTSPTFEGSARRFQNYFDIAVNAKGLIALSCATERLLLVFSRHGRLLQTFGGPGHGSNTNELEAPRGVTVTRLDEFLVADIRKGTLIALKLDSKTGICLERTVVTGFQRPYLVAACISTGMVAVSERGSDTGCEPCIKVLESGWNTIRVLGVCSAMGPVLACPWGICIDRDGDVLVADWGKQHKVVFYPAQGVGRAIVTQGLSSPRGLALLPEGHLVVSDSMHHCIKIYQYK